MGGKRRERTIMLTWSGTLTDVSDNQMADGDPIIYMSGAERASIVLVTPSVAAGAATFDLHTIGGNYLTFSAITEHYQTGIFSAQAESVTSKPVILTLGPHFLKVLLDVNTAAPTTGEDVVVYVWIDYVE